MFQKPSEPEPRDTSNLTDLVVALQDARLALWFPVFQSLARAVTSGLLVWVLAALFGAAGAGRYGLAVFVLTLAWFVWDGIWAWSGDLGRAIGLVEQVIQADIDRDGRIGPAALPARIVRAEVVHKSESGGIGQMQYVNLPAREEQLQLLAAKTAMWGWKIRVRQLTEGAGKIFTQGELDSLLAVMTARGLATQINPDNPQSGYILTDAGIVVMSELADERGPVLPPPPPAPPTERW